jgi:hypothetical protein
MKKIQYYCGYIFGYTIGIVQNIVLNTFDILYDVDGYCCNKECINGCASGYEYIACECGCGSLRKKYY